MTLSSSELLSILPHRPPMLLLDLVSELSPGQCASAQVYINPEWDLFAGHFPLHPLLPGIYITEILAQTAGAMLLSVPEHRGCLPILFEVSHMRFLRPVHPGDTLRTQVSLETAAEQMHVCRVLAYVGDHCAAKGRLTMVLRKEEESL